MKNSVNLPFSLHGYEADMACAIYMYIVRVPVTCAWENVRYLVGGEECTAVHTALLSGGRGQAGN